MSIDTFMSLLAKHGIETVVDVRELPLSRKPGFSKTSLAHRLALSGRKYLHMADLGCPKAIRHRYRKDRNWPRYTDDFMTHLAQQSEAIARLSSLTAGSVCALLCFEADFKLCHRSMVAHAVSDRSGAHVEHIRPSSTLRREWKSKGTPRVPFDFHNGGEGGIVCGCAAHPSHTLGTAGARARRRPSPKYIWNF